MKRRVFCIGGPLNHEVVYVPRENKYFVAPDPPDPSWWAGGPGEGDIEGMRVTRYEIEPLTRTHYRSDFPGHTLDDTIYIGCAQDKEPDDVFILTHLIRAVEEKQH